MSHLDSNPSDARVSQADQRSTPRQRGVLLINTGSPDQPDVPSVRRYLAQFLSDPAVIQLPPYLGWMQGLLGRSIARFRASHSVKLYKGIWTEEGSPLMVITERQAAALAPTLPKGWQVFVAMRYGKPDIGSVIEEIEAAGIEELVVVPMFPHFSRTTTGSVIQELYRVLGRAGKHINVSTRTTWYDDIGYINAQARLVADVAIDKGLTPQDTHLLFSSHGLPVSYIERGDPYLRHVERSVELVTQRLGWPVERSSLAFQSRLGPSEWLGPDVRDRLPELVEAGEKNILVCPISFTADCLETIEEIGVVYRKTVEEKGGKLHLCPALNTYEPFVASMKNLVLRGPQPMTSWGTDTVPLMAVEKEKTPVDGDIESLVMIGASLENRVGSGRGPRLRYSEVADLCCVKKSHDEVHAALKKIGEREGVKEALVWNTCHRFEFYGWLEHPEDAAGRECQVARLRHQLFGEEPDDLGVNVLFGKDAWHHMMRTVAGLNSGLPGDRDLPDQLQTALRLAENAGTAGTRAAQFLDDAAKMERDVRKKTAWGEYDPGYCYAALKRILTSDDFDSGDCRHLMIGGSTTSRSVIETLAERFDVSKRQMALAYRGHKGGQMKLLRHAIGNGKRIRVQEYTERSVYDAIADADVLYFGVDRNEPLLTADVLRGLRDFKVRPLTVIDFNTFGSTEGLLSIEGVTVHDAKQLEHEVDAFAEAMCAEAQFATAVDEAEAWIQKKLPSAEVPYFELPCIKQGQGDRKACRECSRGVQVGVGNAVAGTE